MTEPSKFPIRIGNEDGRPERHTFAPRGLDVDVKACADNDLALYTTDKRISLGVSGEIGQHLPDLLGGRIDLDLGVNLFHTVTSSLT